MNGTFKNEARVLGIKEGVQFPGTWSPVVPDELREEIMADFEKIKSGEMEKRLD
jgi:basic membrane protein A